MTEVLDVRSFQNRLTSRLELEQSDFEKKLTALLWHIELAGKLSKADTDFLDGLTNNLHSIFIIKNNNFIYPQNFDLISPTDIESESYHTANAFFSFNLHLDNGSLINISTSPINSTNRNKLTLGLISPTDLTSSPGVEDSFLSLSQKFREKYTSIQKDLFTVQSALNSDSAVVIISRESGTIITLNNQAKQKYTIPENGVLDYNFSKLQKEMTVTHPNMIFNIANLHSSSDDISIVTFSERETTEIPTHDPKLFLTDQMTNHLSHVMLAYSDLKENFQVDEQEENLKLIDSSLNELTKIHQMIAAYNLINNTESNNTERIHLLSQLEYAIDTNYPAVKIDYDDNLTDLVVTAQKNAIRILFNTTFTALLATGNKNSEIDVSYQHDTSPSLLFSIDNIQRGRIGMFKSYFALLNELAIKTGTTLVHTVNQNNQSIDLTITFSKGESK